MKNLIQELGVMPIITELVVIFCDNNRAIVQAKEPISHYIVRCYHLLVDMVGRVDVRIDLITSAENTADPLTKLVLHIADAQPLGKMTLRNMSDWH
ncbi:UNVERIFIED_CONTAM: hypothetical protein Slati_4474900 [Sesamum latifolium]|uniref:Uncharacterized protein n=1 Tax=Sesamum latifolium TaxID=2727402 RepID=A0AAW2SRN0_9LAMI